ncbi:MAG: hypothetical protein MRZ79_18560 [Bacteroidia bacterium]|nr:hypothetical protein [Bacteroidia bacterium]
MIHNNIFGLLFFVLVFALWGCNNQDNKGHDGEHIDNVINQILDSTEVKPEEKKTIVPELIGSWVVVKMTLDRQTDISQDIIGNLTYTFQKDGKMVFDPKSEFDPETFDYSYDQNVIYSGHFPKEEARITKLNTDSLLFVIETEGEVEYTLVKQK